ncbi:Hypothetical predicted protein [Podarcis lilfordi]|uniref:Uncharacterized protein n=1 Tax=Podarcis lilfordi TaxID=74358 RepID=A0AA35LBE0_9SAUR|nr:Hypothetical predicted protein [Podarcis lilfordi]
MQFGKRCHVDFSTSNIWVGDTTRQFVCWSVAARSVNCKVLICLPEPSTWEEIEKMPDAQASLWKKATQEEMDALHQNKSWTLTELPPVQKYDGGITPSALLLVIRLHLSA